MDGIVEPEKVAGSGTGTSSAPSASGRGEIVKTTMGLWQKDIQNVEILSALFGSRTKADAVSTALSIAKLVAEAISAGDKVLIESKGGGHAERIVIPGLR